MSFLKPRHFALNSLAVAAIVGIGAAVPSTAASTQVAPAMQTFSSATNVHSLALITGERVLESVDAAGRQRLAADASSASAPLYTLKLGSSTMIVDAVALPFIGGRIDTAFFDVGTLAKAGITKSLPVFVDWHGATAPSMPWLLSQHLVSPGLTRGVVTPRSGSLLRADLAQQSPSPTASWSGALSGVDGIHFAGATTPSPPTPAFVQYTLTVNGIDVYGHPDTGGFLAILNVDNGIKFENFAVWNQGVIKLSVPLGHYSALGQFTVLNSVGSGSLHIVALDFTVTGATTVTLDARTATSLVTVSTPQPYASGNASLAWQRTDATGFSSFTAGFLWSFGAGQPAFRVFVAPEPAPNVGSLDWIAGFHLDSTTTIANPYTYDLAFLTVGTIPLTQHYVTTAGQLATVGTRYFSDVPNRLSTEIRLGVFPSQFFASGLLNVIAAPLQRTEYVTALPDLQWSQSVLDDPNDFAGFFLDSIHVYQPGETDTANWGGGPIGPGEQVNTGSGAPFQGCPVCFESGTLEFSLYPFGDNPPGHIGLPNIGAPGVNETDSATLDRDGITIATGPDPNGGVPVPPGPAHYALTYTVAMSAPWWTLSTSTTTEWKFSTPQALSTPPPPGWVCASGSSAGCSVVGLMFADYELPVNLLNEVAAGPTSFHLGVQHVLGVEIPVTSASVAVSFDSGATWQSAHVSPDPTGGYTVAYRNPAGVHAASLRISVRDADGGSLDQTIMDAYAIS